MNLTCDSLCAAFGDRQLFSDVSLTIGAGELVALMGPNGVGKTTWLRIAAGLIEPAGGRVLLGDDDVSRLARREAARRVAMVPQSRPPVFQYSVYEVVLMGLHARLSRFGSPGDDQRARATAELELLDIDHLADRALSTLSGGEAQRVLMARAAVSGAPIWLLDEPTANLDPKHQQSLLARVRGHVSDGGSAVAAMHDLSLVERHFDRVVVLADGGVAADGAPTEVLTATLLEQVFGAPANRGERWVFGN